MEVNPYEPPQAPPAEPERRSSIEAVPRPLVRVGIGVFAGMYAAPSLWVLVVFTTQLHNLAELLVLPPIIGGGIAAGCLTFSPNAAIRVVVWLAAGLGVGLTLDAMMAGGLGFGDFLTPSGMVLGLVLAVIGWRAKPSR